LPEQALRGSQDGRRAHVGLHHCDGGPEPARHDLPLQQVEGMPLREAQQQQQQQCEAAAEATSTDGESNTRIDEGAVCASASRCKPPVSTPELHASVAVRMHPG
jgi:hypothetical protein